MVATIPSAAAAILGALVLAFQDPAPPTPLQRDYMALRKRAQAYKELVEHVREAEPEQRAALAADERKEREVVQAAYRTFFETHAKPRLGSELAKLFVASTKDQALSTLFPTWVAWSLEHGTVPAFLDACKSLEAAGLDAASRDRLDHPRAIAHFARGSDAEALVLATQRAAALGSRGILLLDVAAAIHAANGEIEKARALYTAWLAEHGDADLRYAPQVRTKAQRLGQPVPSLGPLEWIGPRGAAHAGFAAGEALKGRVVLLDFWQSWCGPCRAQMKELSRLQREFPEKVRVIGLCKDDATPGADAKPGRDGFDAQEQRLPAASIAGAAYAPHVREFVKAMELDYLFAVAPPASQVLEELEVRSFPTLWVIDREGRLMWIAAGAGPGLPLLLRTLAQRLAAR